jgi:hypothetical protein
MIMACNCYLYALISGNEEDWHKTRELFVLSWARDRNPAALWNLLLIDSLQNDCESVNNHYVQFKRLKRKQKKRFATPAEVRNLLKSC